MQVQLLTVLVRLEEVPAKQVRDVYKLLLDDSYAVRHAAAELVADMLEESGQRHLAQVSCSPYLFLCPNVWLLAALFDDVPLHITANTCRQLQQRTM